MTNETIEATHVRQTIFRSTLHYSHGMSEEIDRLVFNLSDDHSIVGPFLVVYFWERHLEAYYRENGKDLSRENFREIRRVLVPQELFSEAKELADLQNRVAASRFESEFVKITHV